MSSNPFSSGPSFLDRIKKTFGGKTRKEKSIEILQEHFPAPSRKMLQEVVEEANNRKTNLRSRKDFSIDELESIDKLASIKNKTFDDNSKILECLDFDTNIITDYIKQKFIEVLDKAEACDKDEFVKLICLFNENKERYNEVGENIYLDPVDNNKNSIDAIIKQELDDLSLSSLFHLINSFSVSVTKINDVIESILRQKYLLITTGRQKVLEESEVKVDVSNRDPKLVKNIRIINRKD